MNKISIVIVTYNRLELLKKCLKKALSQKLADVIVINNASTDETENYIKLEQKNKNFFYYNTGKNLGGAGGFAVGIKKAIELKYDYIFVMDDDTMLEDNTIEKLSGQISKIKDFSFLSCKVLWKNGTLCCMNIPKISGNILEYHKYLEDGVIHINSSSFVGCLINAKYVLEVGLPISEFFIWCDDVEFTSRLSKKAPGFLVTGSVVIHECARNDFASIYRENDANRIKRYIYLYRNRFYNMRKKGLRGLVRYFLLLNKDLMYTIFFGKHKIFKICTILKGFILGLFFYPKIEMVEENEVK